ncbi:MAG TPA: DNA-processing protein DprA [Polyangia bacterium]|nr:DNA-processing protein DprA [Polyangia bacterium]
MSASADLENGLVTPADGSFPAALRTVRPAVKTLWFRGDLPREDEPAVAIVGARAASLPACRLAAELAGVAARAGFAVVSGGALGIDGAAHAGALDAGGRTFAVLGCGVDVVYPDRHAALFQRIARGGGLLSDFPPGTEAHRRHFPSRNRLVAGLARAVLVVDARQLSGALITARLATQMNRPLFAVPGSAGTDGLIAAGKAQALRDGADWFAVLTDQPPPLHVPPDELLAVVAAVRGGAAASQVARHLAVPLPVALALLSEAELAGWILRGPGGVYTSTEVTLAS